MSDETAYTGETVSGDAEDDDALEAARTIGAEHGTDAGSWIVDGNTDPRTLRYLIMKSEEGELVDYLNPSAPLSGEFADDYSCGRLSDDLAVDQDSDGFDDLCTAYEDAYWQAFEDEVVRSCRGMLPETAEEGER